MATVSTFRAFPKRASFPPSPNCLKRFEQSEAVERLERLERLKRLERSEAVERLERLERTGPCDERSAAMEPLE
jgi:hypothetical protein